MDWIAELAAEIDGEALTDEASRVKVSTDFGGVVERQPQVVVRPASTRDVAAVVKLAGRHSLRVSARGAGHSQNGQSLCDQIVLDMRGLNRIRSVDAARRSVTCQAGVTWRALVESLFPLGLSPPVLTNNLDVTAGGTLSTGGLGVSSWRYGTQADQCLEAEVVTGEGEVIRCSPSDHAELFEVVCCGLGQFGIVTEVTLRLRQHKPCFRSFYLLYDELEVLLADLLRLMEEGKFDYLESWCVPLPQGFSNAGRRSQLLAQWFFPLHVTVETGGLSGSESGELEGLRYYKHVHSEAGSLQEFFARLDPLFELWKQSGFWNYTHPWMECILPWSSATAFVRSILELIPVPILQGGHILLWPARRAASPAPFFMKPDDDYLLGFGILPAVPKPFLDQSLSLLDRTSKAALAVGGKRYLSGWFDFDASSWMNHYGPQWPTVAARKQQYDPGGIFGSAFLK